jgi:hypothetical protein
MKTILFITLSLILFSASCKKNKKCSRDYYLEHPVSIYPVKDSYSIGDTIWIEMNFSDVFTLYYPNTQNTNEYFSTTAQLKDFDFNRNYLSFSKLVDSSVNLNGQFDDVWEYFTPLLANGTIIYSHHDGPEYKLSYDNNQYQFKIGLIFNQIGKFICVPGYGKKFSSSQGYLNEQDITPECEKEILNDIHFPINRQLDGTYQTNYHLFEQFMNPALENDLERIKNRCFTFVVN